MGNHLEEIENRKHVAKLLSDARFQLDRIGRNAAQTEAAYNLICAAVDVVLLGDYATHSGSKTAYAKLSRAALKQGSDSVHKAEQTRVNELQLVEEVQKYAKEHYEENGWDFVVECWEPSDILKVIAGAKSRNSAIARVLAIVKVQHSRRLDVEGEAF